MWHATHTLNHFASKTADAEFQALHVFHRLDFFTVPAAHLSACVAHWEVNHVVLSVKLTHQLAAVAFVHPSCHLTAVQTKRNGTTQSKCFVLTEEVVRGSVSHLNGAVLYAINHAECRHQFASCVHGDGELATRHLTNFLSESFSSAKNSVQSFWKA